MLTCQQQQQQQEEEKEEQQQHQLTSNPLRQLAECGSSAADVAHQLLSAVTDSSSVGSIDAPEPVRVLQFCANLLKRDNEAELRVRQLLAKLCPDCTSLSDAAPTLPLRADKLAWLQFKRVLLADESCRLKVTEFVESVRNGNCVLFSREADEDAIIESLFPEHRYLLKRHGAVETARRLPDLLHLRLLHSNYVNNFHKTARSDDCLIVDAAKGPKVKVRQPLIDLKERRMHIVTPELIDELYEYFRREAMDGVRATTGAANCRK